jgi:hypothetical protein
VDGEFASVWREKRIQRLLSTEDADVLFSQRLRTDPGQIHSQFDHVVWVKTADDPRQHRSLCSANI